MATERVGRYQLLEPIGTGPCGSVARAKVFGVAGFERQFAVKRFHPELTITTALAQALSVAARAYGSLEHPRIARMSEFGVAQGQTFTAVEFVAGLDAARLVAEARLAGNSLAAGGALALVSQAARAVGYAHGRGLTHLGLAPTNVIVTPDGDVKITDFSILAAGLPQRPIDVARLQHRIQYLAPEQIANEATSAATDVFALGVIAYELVTGQRTFRGETAQQVAHSIMAGPPGEPALPRPIVRVLQRCLARSPFERFPDARAVADALDAALRVAPVPGTRKDIGAQVKQTQERLAALHDGEMSGMVALNVGTGPVRREPAPEVASLGRENPSLEVSTREFVRPDVPVPGPTPLTGPATTMPEMPRPMTTIAGMAPPPIPVPVGISTGGSPPPIPPAPGGASTLLGIAKVPSTIPAIKPKRTSDPAIPRTLTPPPAPRPPGNEELEMEMLFGSEGPGLLDSTIPGVGAAPPRARRPSDHPTSVLSPVLADKLGEASIRGTTEVEPLIAEAFAADALSEFAEEQQVTRESPAPPPSSSSPPSQPLPSPAELAKAIRPAVTRPGTPPPPTPPAIRPHSAPIAAAPKPDLHNRPEPANSRMPMIVALTLLGGLGLGLAGWQIYKRISPGDHEVASATPTADAVTAVASKSDAVATMVDAGTVVEATVDAALVVAADAAVAKPHVVTATAASDSLTITSTPAGARVYLDGAETGVTPLKLPASADRHTVALLLGGHELYIAQVDGAGAFAIPLKEVTPPGGPAGVKVLKCKDKDRYYVFLDGKPTGQMCPTERIDTDVGPHTVEVYDAVTETRKKFDVVVKDTRLSVRVKIE